MCAWRGGPVTASYIAASCLAPVATAVTALSCSTVAAAAAVATAVTPLSAAASCLASVAFDLLWTAAMHTVFDCHRLS